MTINRAARRVQARRARPQQAWEAELLSSKLNEIDMSDNMAHSAVGQHFNCGGTVKVCTDGKYTWTVCLKCEQNVMMVSTQTEAKSK